MASSELQALMATAEQAAASDDYVSAERCLREAASLQERTRGANHPDLANTFNNLGVVCERSGKPDEAEACYRRAYVIATGAFPTDHPFVETSRKNLEDLCHHRGRPLDMRAFDSETDARRPEAPRYLPHDEVAPPRDSSAVAVVNADLSAGASANADLSHGEAAAQPDLPYYTARRESARAPRESRAAPRAISWALAIVGIGIAVASITWLASRSRVSNEPVRTALRETTPSVVRPLQPAAPVAPPPVSEPVRPAPPPEPASAATAPSALTVADMRLCRSLTRGDEWRCNSIGTRPGMGPVYFYTRVVASRDTIVQHRWYFDDRLFQNVKLDVHANPSGYRTFSRVTMNNERIGRWKVELRTVDGRLLREERFTVR
ncbi:MAG TPA: DUF2914 domain-containing protein [Vicinamibacterales bacterium]|jgi:hypothetical protein